MKHTNAAMLVLGLCSVSLHAGFLEDYQAVCKLKPAEAAPRFESLAKTAPAAQKNNVLYQAGKRYITLKDYAKAENIASQITDKKAVLLKMQIAQAQNNWNIIWKLSETEDITAWSEADQFTAYYLRGSAAMKMGKLDLCEADTKAALEIVPNGTLEKAVLYNRMAMICKLRRKEADSLIYYQMIIDMKSLANYGIYKDAVREYKRISAIMAKAPEVKK